MAPCINVNQARKHKRAQIHAAITRQATRIALQTISALVSGTSRRSLLNTTSLGYLPRVEISDDPNSPTMVAIFEIPGVSRDQISVTISHGIMHVRGRRVQRSLREYRSGTVSNGLRAASDNCAPHASVRFPVQELRYGHFGRGVKLPEGIREDDLTTSLSDGLFIVTWPRQAKTTPDVVTPGEGQTSEGCSGL